METVALKVNKRDGRGKGPARRVRAGGKVPGIFYGPRQREAVLLELEQVEFAKKLGVLEGAHLIQFDSEVPELKDRVVLLREVQSHPVTGHVLHADFYEVDLTRKLEVTVPLHFTGRAAGVEQGGILQPIVREITVNCLPTDIPEFIPVDVSALEIHDSIHIADLTFAEGVEPVYDENFTLVTVTPPTVEEVKVEAPVEGAVVEGAAEAPAEGGTETKAAGPKKTETK